jgi:rhodanese-related sulfurtransferase
MSVLQPDTRYVVYCDTGLRSAAAAFILAERGIEACVLRDGLSSIQPGVVQVANG